MSNNKGFTLIEILVALVMFALVAGSLAYMQIVSIRGAEFSKEAMRATVAAQQQIETIKSQVFGTTNSNTAGVEIAGVPGMVMKWVIDAPTGTVPARTQKATVNVIWGGRTLSFITTLSEQ